MFRAMLITQIEVRKALLPSRDDRESTNSGIERRYG